MTDHFRVEIQECPAIFVSVAEIPDEQLYRWVETGAEEEGVPCRKVPADGADPVMLAYSAAQGSRLGVGVGVAGGRVALHEVHMPAGKPVLILDATDGFARVCRLAGSNAGRLVKRMPLRFLEGNLMASEPMREAIRPPGIRLSQCDARAVASAIARVLKQRGAI